MRATSDILPRAAGALLVAALASGASRAAAQAAAGAELWRLAAVSVPVPLALDEGGTAAFWNPAQAPAPGAAAGAEVVSTPPEIGATGILAAARLGAGRLGSLGVIFGRMSLGGLERTDLSPDPIGEVSFYTEMGGVTWAGRRGGTTLGATAAVRDTRLDVTAVARWSFDVGLAQELGPVRLAAATHFLSGFAASDPGRDAYAGAEWRAWRGALWAGGGDVTVLARYGLTFSHGSGADQAFGTGLAYGDVFAFDAMLSRETSYGNVTWRGVGGARVAIGRWRIFFSRDLGVNDVGAVYRVGLEARFR